MRTIKFSIIGIGGLFCCLLLGMTVQATLLESPAQADPKLGSVAKTPSKMASPFIATMPVKIEISTVITQDSDDDFNQNGQIDAGEMIKFQYTITNNGDIPLTLSTLDTMIPSNQFNFIHDVFGATGIDASGDTILIPFVHLEPNQVQTISFKACINYFVDSDLTLETASALILPNGQTVVRGPKKTIIIKKGEDKNSASTTINQIIPEVTN